MATSFEGLAAFSGPSDARAGPHVSAAHDALFRGDGYSWTEDGRRSGAEFLIPRVLVESLQPTAVVPLCWERG